MLLGSPIRSSSASLDGLRVLWSQCTITCVPKIVHESQGHIAPALLRSKAGNNPGGKAVDTPHHEDLVTLPLSISVLIDSQRFDPHDPGPVVISQVSKSDIECISNIENCQREPNYDRSKVVL